MLITAIAAEVSIAAGCAEHEIVHRDPLMLVLGKVSTFSDNDRALTALSRGLELLLNPFVNEVRRDTLGSSEIISKVHFCQRDEADVLRIVHAVFVRSGRALVATIAALGRPADP